MAVHQLAAALGADGKPSALTWRVASQSVTGRVFGLMPHPERFLRWENHPRWTREGLAEEGDGLRLFRNAVYRQWDVTTAMLDTATRDTVRALVNSALHSWQWRSFFMMAILGLSGIKRLDG